MVSHNNEQPQQPVLPAPTQGASQQSSGSVQKQPPQSNAATPVPTGADSNATTPAQDTDVIEQVWVTRVESAFSAHAQDPRELARQLSAIKAEYIAGRYGMTLKQGSEQE